MSQTNWAGNLTYSSQIIDVATIEQLQQIIADNDEVKVVATGHTFNDIADSSVALVSLKNMTSIEIDKHQQTVTIGAGIRYGELAVVLHDAGYALHNLASLPHISVVGACATGTHGSGVDNGNLATSVTAIEFLDSNGNLHSFTGDDNRFYGLPVNLGAIGIITKMTLEIQPTYNVRQTVFLDVPLDDYVANFEAVMSSGYSVSTFTHWHGDTIKQVWVKQRADETVIESLLGIKQADKKSHPIVDAPATHATEQLGTVGAWHTRLPHFKLEFTPSNGDELQSEYFISAEHAVEAIQALQSIGEQMQDVLLVSEIRRIAADNLWMSPCYQRDSVAFHFTWKQDWKRVRQVLLEVERVLEPFAPRPHMGKLFTMPPEIIRSRYPLFDDFRELVLEINPSGKFRNRFLSTLLGA